MRGISHLCCLGLIAIIPFSYHTDYSDSSQVRFGLGAGTGRYATILESCGNIEGKGTGEFNDIGAEAAVRLRPPIPVVVGIRGGHLSADSKTDWSFHPNELPDASFDNGYFNPYISLESKYAGFGIGWLRNIGPTIPEEWFDHDPDWRKGKDYLSGHIRIGLDSRLYGMLSFFEGVPIASQYGYVFLGAGGSYRKWYAAAGYSGGFYDAAGIYAAIGRDFSRFGRPMLSIRRGSSHGEFEGAVSLRWSWPVF